MDLYKSNEEKSWQTPQPLIWYSIRNLLVYIYIYPHIGLPPKQCRVVSQNLRPVTMPSLCSDTVSSIMANDAYCTVWVMVLDVTVRVSKQFWVKQEGINFIAFASTWRCRQRFEPSIYLIQDELLAERWTTELMPNVLYCTLLANVSSQQLHMTRHTLVGYICDNLTTIVQRNQFLWRKLHYAMYFEVVSIIQTEYRTVSSTKASSTKIQITGSAPSKSCMTAPLCAENSSMSWIDLGWCELDT